MQKTQANRHMIVMLRGYKQSNQRAKNMQSIAQQSEAIYERLKSVIIAHTGLEQDVNTRDDTERLHAHMLLARELNQTCALGLDATDLKLMALINTSLSYTNRFSDDPNILPQEGESPVKHSAHAAAEYFIACYRAKFDTATMTREAIESEEFSNLVREGALTCLWHDGDEVFGEPTTVQSRAVTGEVEQDSSQGLRVLQYAMRLAMHAIEAEERGDEHALDDFFTSCKTIRDLSDVKNAGFTNILRYIDAHPDPSISAQSEARITKALRYYAVAENKLPEWHELTAQDAPLATEISPHDQFVSSSVKCCERGEGSAHFRRFMVNSGVEPTTYGKARSIGAIQERIRARDGVIPHTPINSIQRSESHFLSMQRVPTNSVGMMKSLEYAESKIGEALLNGMTDLERAVGKQLALASYANIAQRIARGPQYIDRFPEERDDYAAQKEQARGRLDTETFQRSQDELRRRYLEERRALAAEHPEYVITKGIPLADKPRWIMTDVMHAGEMISMVQQTIRHIEENDWDGLCTVCANGKQQFLGIIKRTEHLPETYDLNRPPVTNLQAMAI
ncbi:MAG: hypothetical protein ACOYJ2_01015 [Rickettsiales bacterium]